MCQINTEVKRMFGVRRDANIEKRGKATHKQKRLQLRVRDNPRRQGLALTSPCRRGFAPDPGVWASALRGVGIADQRSTICHCKQRVSSQKDFAI
jgi:hypothetical protein